MIATVEGGSITVRDGDAVVASEHGWDGLFTDDGYRWVKERGMRPLGPWLCRYRGWTVGPPYHVRPTHYECEVEWVPYAELPRVPSPWMPPA